MHGLDATAAQTFGTLFNMLESLGVELVITHMENPEMEKLLRAHGVIGVNCCMCARTAGFTAPYGCHHTDDGRAALHFSVIGFRCRISLLPTNLGMSLAFLIASANICKSRAGSSQPPDGSTANTASLGMLLCCLCPARGCPGSHIPCSACLAAPCSRPTVRQGLDPVCIACRAFPTTQEGMQSRAGV